MSIILKKERKSSENLIYITFASAFLHFIITGIVMAVLGCYILFNSKRRQAAFSHVGKTILIIFTVYTAVVAALRDNFIGLACSVGFFVLFVISYYVRTEITGDVFQRSLDIACIMSIVVFVSVFIEKQIHSHEENYRCIGWFMNSNYLCTMMAMMIIVCTYKIIAAKKGKFFYYFTALLCAITMYMGGSIFAFVEVFVGILTILILYKKHSVLAFALSLMAIGLLVLYLAPEIFPRILESDRSTELRVLVWNSSLRFIKLSPLFGHGFMSYHHLDKLYGSDWSSGHHAHNFILEPIMSFGIIGSIIFIILLWSFFEKVSECKSLLRKNKATNLILALSAATIIHCTVDLTIMWIQTALLFLLIMAGIGVDEKALARRIKACLARSERAQKSPEEENQNG